MCDPLTHVDTPVGEICNGWCDEPIEADDTGVILPGFTECHGIEKVFYHRNCFLRQSLGSAGHQLRRCTCFVKADDATAFHDPPGLTLREAADEAVAIFESQHGSIG